LQRGEADRGESTGKKADKRVSEVKDMKELE